MLILNFLKELAALYSDLNPTLSVCYHMSDNELYLGGVLKSSVRLQNQHFENLPEQNLKKVAFGEFFINFEQKKVKCIYLLGMYFMPGVTDEAIIFSKDLNLILENSWSIKQVDYEITNF